jgi:hypothetical protein
MVIFVENNKDKLAIFTVVIAILCLSIAIGLFYFSEKKEEEVNPPEPEDVVDNGDDGELPNNDDDDDEVIIIGSGEKPLAEIECSLGDNCSPQTDCSAYQGCDFVIINNSSDINGDIALCKWQIRKEGEEDYRELFSCNTKFDKECNYTVQPTLESGDYQIKLYVEDKAKNYSSTTQSISILKDARAGFECSLEGGENPDNYFSCERLDFSGKKIVYFRYNLPDSHENSRASEGATINLSQVLWYSEDEEWSQSGSAYVSREMEEGKIIHLKIVDSNGREDSVTHKVGKKDVPIWSGR